MTDATDRPQPDQAEAGELPDLRRRLLAGMLRHAPFDGWNVKALHGAARDEGVTGELAEIAFPGGPLEIAEFFSQDADRRMAGAVRFALDEATQAARAATAESVPWGQPGVSGPSGPGGAKVPGMKIRDKVALAVRTRLLRQAPHREALRAMAGFLALPAHAALAARLLWRTVDAMWYAIGDRSTDVSYYSKRALLAGVYGSTLLVWLDDRSEGSAESLAFLDRRIDDVMAFERGKARWRELLNGVAGRVGAVVRPGSRRRSYHPDSSWPKGPGATPSA